jgi:hypothetical protein
MQRVERHHRLLENHGNFIATDPAQDLFIGVQQRAAVKQNIPCG